MANIVFLDEYSLNDADLNGIRALGNYTGYEFTAPEQVLERAANADILIVNKVKLTADIICRNSGSSAKRPPGWTTSTCKPPPHAVFP